MEIEISIKDTMNEIQEVSSLNELNKVIKEILDQDTHSLYEFSVCVVKPDDMAEFYDDPNIEYVEMNDENEGYVALSFPYTIYYGCNTMNKNDDQGLDVSLKIDYENKNIILNADEGEEEDRIPKDEF
ncbi:MAG: hypothetical protein HPY53_01175 [Brevinematales bacterium]|nr:hypothetical protein [Brevinematales bacterium]